MSFETDGALGLDPPESIPLRHPRDAVAWARSIPDFGWETEVYALFLDGRRLLLRAAWLGPGTTFDDFAEWPDFVLGYSPVAGAEAVLLLVCRPGEGTDPMPDDRDVWDVVRVAHSARGVPVIDVVLIDGLHWRSLADALD